MARIRTIKPEFWSDEKLSLLDDTTRLVFLGLVSFADDAGRLIDNVKTLDGLIFPNTDSTCGPALDTLARLSRVIRYVSASGQPLLQIANWDKHQKVDKASKYVLPGPDVAVIERPIPPEDSRDSRETVAKDSRPDLLPTTKDQGPRTEVVEKAATALAIAANKGLSEHPTAPQAIARIIAGSGATFSAAEQIVDAGVPIEFATGAVYDLARSHNADGQVKSLRYFVDAVIRRWQEHSATEHARTSSAPTATAKRNGRTPPQRFDYPAPTNSEQDVKWQP